MILLETRALIIGQATHYNVMLFVGAVNDYWGEKFTSDYIQAVSSKIHV